MAGIESIEVGFCRLTKFHLFRCQLKRCGLDPEKIDYKNIEERALARECIKRLYTSQEWKERGGDYFKLFARTELGRRRRKKEKELLESVRRKRIYGRNKKLSWEQIWELLHNGEKTGIRTFIGEGAWKLRRKRWGVSGELILSMSKKEFKDYITTKMLEKRLGKGWREILHDVWFMVKYRGSRAECLLHELEIRKKDWLGLSFEEFISLIKDRLWEKDRGELSRREKYEAGYRKERTQSSKRVIDNVEEVVRLLKEGIPVRHVLLLVSKRLYNNIRSYFERVDISKEELLNYLTEIAKPRKEIWKTDNVDVLIEILDRYGVGMTLFRADKRLYDRIKAYFRQKGKNLKEISKEELMDYLKYTYAKRRGLSQKERQCVVF